MRGDVLTRDNLHLSRANQLAPAELDHSEINFTWVDVGQECRLVNHHDAHTEQVAALIASSISDNTRRAYRSDLSHFEGWGGPIPATPTCIAAYLAAHVDKLSVATLGRRVASLSKAHDARGFTNPCRSEIVRATVRGIKRSRGKAQKQARALEREDLMLVLEHIGGSVRDVRDRALLLLGFAGGFRRSELVGLDYDDVEHDLTGILDRAD